MADEFGTRWRTVSSTFVSFFSLPVSSNTRNDKTIFVVRDPCNVGQWAEVRVSDFDAIRRSLNSFFFSFLLSLLDLFNTLECVLFKEKKVFQLLFPSFSLKDRIPLFTFSFLL